MNKFDIKLGDHYAFRDNIRKQEAPLRVAVLMSTRAGHFKVRFLDDDDSGVEQQVKAANIIWPWKDNKRRLRDEANADALHRHVKDSWRGDNDPVVVAVQEVLDGCGESVWVHRGVLSVESETLERLSYRAGVSVPELRYPAYKGADGRLHFPWATALDVVRGLCTSEPSPILLSLEASEREWDIKARESGNSYMLGLINEYRPAHALIRQWTSYDSAIARKDAEIKRLRELIERTVWDLRRNGEESMASKLDRGLRGG